MKNLTKLLSITENAVEKRERIILIELATRLCIQYQYESKTTVYSKELITDKFYAVQHGQKWVSFSHANFNSRFLLLFKRRYNSTKEINTVSAIRLAHDYNKRKLCEYARKVHPRISEDDVKISFENIQLIQDDKYEYAIPTAIIITIADPNGLRSTITNCLESM